ncbi:MAG: hypothetical protein H7256_10835 [Bdellovibrio sp.]|nr:hypothetical protein [Bdellovibrio sp.]
MAFVLTGLCCSLALADDELDALRKKRAENETVEQKFIDSNIAISNWLDGAAEGLDLFLVGKKLTDAKNETHVRIENSTYSMEGANLTNATSLNVNLRLPNLEEYWQLKFTTYDDTEESRSVKSGYLRQTPRQENYGATVGLFRKLGNIRTSFQPRIGLQDPLKVSHSLRFESILDTKTYKINPKLEFYADADKGTGIYWNLNFNFELSPLWSLTLINEANYEDKTHLYSAGNGFSFGNYINETSTMGYTLIFTSLNQPSYHLDSFSASVSWNQLIYKKILDYQIIPHLDFARAQSFKGAAGLIFNLNLNF